MEKWEYLTCYTSGFNISIAANISIEQLATAFPSYKVVSSTEGLIAIGPEGETDYGNLAKIIEIRISVLDFLGSQGWEAYCVDDGTFYFKRRI